ncbi:MAG: class I SAM-dependent methyltransferase [Isosphaeraceae bacterium]
MIERWSAGSPDDGMAEEILLELGDRIRAHPWWLARAALTLGLLETMGVRPPARVLDAGCGWGVTLEALERRGYRASGLDVSRRTLERLDRPGRRLIEADLSGPLPDHAGAAFDAVLALDVLEHLDDDRAAVRGLGALAIPGGLVIVSVPALPALFGEFDAIQGHRRRYLPETLRAAFDDSGLALERAFWWGRWLVPALRRQRSRPRSRPGETPAEIYRRYLTLPPWPLPWLARAAFALEHRPALRGRLSTGTSLFAVARRPACSVESPSRDVGEGGRQAG